MNEPCKGGIMVEGDYGADPSPSGATFLTRKTREGIFFIRIVVHLLELILLIMSSLFDQLNTREQALMLWVAVLLLLLCFKADVRRSIFDLLKLFFFSKIGFAFFIMAGYCALIAWWFYKIGWWHYYLLKDQLFWFFGVAFPLFLKINKADSNTFFIRVVKESIKWTIVLEFISNFYSFSIWVELFLVPLIILIAGTKAYADVYYKNDLSQEPVKKLLEHLLVITGLICIGYSFYNTFIHPREVFTFQSFQSLLLPVVFTLLILPFLYLLAVLIQYETLFVDIKIFTQDNALEQSIKKEIFLEAGIDLDKIVLISKKLKTYDLIRSNDFRAYIRSLLREDKR